MLVHVGIWICILDGVSVLVEGHLIFTVFKPNNHFSLTLKSMLSCSPPQISLSNLFCNKSFLHSQLPFVKIKLLHGYLLINICSPPLHTHYSWYCADGGCFQTDVRHCHSQGRFAAYLIEWLISEWVFSLHYLLCGSAWLHEWTDCSTQGDAFRNFQLPASESRHWHCSVGFRPNGLHFLLLALQWCWNQPLSLKRWSGWWLVTCYWSGNKGRSDDEQASGFIYGYTMNFKWGQIFSFSLSRSHLVLC